MPEDPPEFGVTHDSEARPVPYLSKPLCLWRDGEVEAGLDQVVRRIRRHPQFRAELERLEQDLLGEQQRRRALYANIAAVFVDSEEEPPCPE